MKSIRELVRAAGAALTRVLPDRKKPRPRPHPSPPTYEGGVVRDGDGTVLRDKHGRALKSNPKAGSNT